MPNAYAQIAFTPKVRAEQRRSGSADIYARVLAREREDGASLTAKEADFLANRDGFFQATVSETGWPYVQFRGGTPGFLKVIDAQTIGYADYLGNRQFISLGNLNQDDRISIIAVDYVHQRRLKLLGHAQVSEDPDVVSLLQGNDGPKAERAIIIHIDAFDWNCPQHIPVRLTDAERDNEIAQLHARIKALESRQAEKSAPENSVGFPE